MVGKLEDKFLDVENVSKVWKHNTGVKVVRQ